MVLVLTAIKFQRGRNQGGRHGGDGMYVALKEEVN